VASLQNFAGVRVDGLQQPGGDAAGSIDSGADAQHEALAAGEVEVALEVGAIDGQMDVDVADLEVAQAQAADVEVGIEFGDDAQLAGGLVAGVAEGNGIRQGGGGWDVFSIVALGRLRAAHADDCIGRGTLLRRLLQVLGETQRLAGNRLELAVQHADVAQVFHLGATAGEDLEVHEMRVGPGIAVVTKPGRPFRAPVLPQPRRHRACRPGGFRCSRCPPSPPRDRRQRPRYRRTTAAPWRKSRGCRPACGRCRRHGTAGCRWPAWC
jgi:hypothetical protein